MPKVSVILPIYNVASYLDDAFLSLINQTLEDIEIIVVNDGSTDESQQYIEKYGLLKGIFLGAWRIIRCNPFSKGGYDPLR